VVIQNEVERGINGGDWAPGGAAPLRSGAAQLKKGSTHFPRTAKGKKRGIVSGREKRRTFFYTAEGVLDWERKKRNRLLIKSKKDSQPTTYGGENGANIKISDVRKKKC